MAAVTVFTSVRGMSLGTVATGEAASFCVACEFSDQLLDLALVGLRREPPELLAEEGPW